MDSTPQPPLSANFPKEHRETPESGKPIKCDLCDVWCQGVVSYQTHLQGRPHYANLVKKPEDATNGQTPKRGKKRSSGQDMEELRCETCDISCLGRDQYEAHLQGIRHTKKSRLSGNEDVDLSAMPFIKDLGGGKRYQCTICNVEMTGKVVVKSHVTGVKHLRKADPNAVKTESSNAVSNKGAKTTPTGEPLECKICKIPVNSLFQLNEHQQSLKHKHKEEAYNKWAIKEANIGKDYDAWDPTG